MAETTTFETLKQDLRRYLERGATYASDSIVFEQIPRLINLAERRCARELKIQGFLTVVTGTMTPGQSVYPKPDRWRETTSINFGTGVDNATRKFLMPRSYEYCRVYWPDESETAEPLFVSDYQYDHWLIAPTPDQAYPFEVVYWGLPDLLDDENQSNWITEFAPELLLYASLLEAVPFLKDDSRIPVWQQFYDRAAGMISGEDVAKILDRTAVRKTA